MEDPPRLAYLRPIVGDILAQFSTSMALLGGLYRMETINRRLRTALF